MSFHDSLQFELETGLKTGSHRSIAESLRMPPLPLANGWQGHGCLLSEQFAAQAVIVSEVEGVNKTTLLSIESASSCGGAVPASVGLNEGR